MGGPVSIASASDIFRVKGEKKKEKGTGEDPLLFFWAEFSFWIVQKQ
jgi:hypothetical protein